MSLGEDIPLENIRATMNPRTDPEDKVDTLMRSIQQHDLLEPIGIRPRSDKPGHYDLIYGHRRFIALQKLNWTKVTLGKHVIIVTPEGSGDEKKARIAQLEKALEENLRQVPQTYVETAKVMHRLVYQEGISPEQVAARFSTSREDVKRRIAMIETQPEGLKKLMGWGPKSREDSRLPAQVMNRITYSHTIGPEHKLEVAMIAVRDTLPLPKVNIILGLVAQGLEPEEAAKLAGKCVIKNAAFLLNADSYKLWMETQPRGMTWTKAVRLALAGKMKFPADLFYDGIPFKRRKGEKENA